VLIGLVPAVVLGIAAVARDPSSGAVVAAVALIGLSALPLWWRWHSGAFRLSAGLIGVAICVVCLLTAPPGLLLLPTGLLLLAAALIPAAR
jgi:hypothetical protein